jgi:hypothetical protein
VSDELEQLLRHADDVGPASTPAGRARELAEAVRQRHRRRQARRARTGAAAAMVIACVVLGSLLMNPSLHARRSARTSSVTTQPVAINTIDTAPTVDPEQARAAYRRLVAEADRREAIAARVQHSRPRVSAQRSTPGELRLELQREEATLLLLHQGDVLARDPALRGPAAVAYRQAVELFPETSAAATAKQRLDTLN